MSNEQSVTKWLKKNKDLSWTRTNGDEPPVKMDRIYLNRSEGYEIRDFILRYYKECNLAHSEKNYELTFKKIKSYKPSEKVKTEDILEHLAK